MATSKRKAASKSKKAPEPQIAATVQPEYVQDALLQVHGTLYDQLGKVAPRIPLSIKPKDDDLAECSTHARKWVHALQQTLQADYVKTFCPERSKSWTNRTTQQVLDEIWLKQAESHKLSVDTKLAEKLKDHPKFASERIWKIVIRCIATHKLGCIDLTDGATGGAYELDIKCSDRLEKIRTIMEQYPLVRNDVLNGKCLDAFVCHPEHYINGKLSNFESNQLSPKYGPKKPKGKGDKVVQDGGIENASVEGDLPTPSSDGSQTGVPRKRKHIDADADADADYDPQPVHKAAKTNKSAKPVKPVKPVKARNALPAAQPTGYVPAGARARNVNEYHASVGASQPAYAFPTYATEGGAQPGDTQQSHPFAGADRACVVHQNNVTAGAHLPISGQSFHAMNASNGMANFANTELHQPVGNNMTAERQVYQNPANHDMFAEDMSMQDGGYQSVQQHGASADDVARSSNVDAYWMNQMNGPPTPPDMSQASAAGTLPQDDQTLGSVGLGINDGRDDTPSSMLSEYDPEGRYNHDLFEDEGFGSLLKAIDKTLQEEGASQSDTEAGAY